MVFVIGVTPMVLCLCVKGVNPIVFLCYRSDSSGVFVLCK